MSYTTFYKNDFEMNVGFRYIIIDYLLSCKMFVVVVFAAVDFFYFFYTEIKSNDYNSSTKHKVKIFKFAFTKFFTLLCFHGVICEGTEAAGIWVFRVFSMPLDGRTGTWVWTVLIKYLIDHYSDK